MTRLFQALCITRPLLLCSFIFVFHFVRDVTLALFQLLVLFRLFQLPLRRNRLLVLSSERRAAPWSSIGFPLLFFSRPSRWKPSGRGRDRGTCTGLHASKAIAEWLGDVCAYVHRNVLGVN